MKRLALGLALAFAALRAGALPIDLRAEALFYGDNTEFFNPYRTGETIFGVYARAYFAAKLGERVEVRAGVFGNERFGSESSFDLVRPVLALRVGTPRSLLVFGTLETALGREGIGPDRMTLHGLLPALQRETLAFTRPHESGVQWLLATPRVSSDLWLNWQELNTPEHREVLDAGVASRATVWGPFSAALQAHVVHHGGQLHDVGPVSDSYAFGAGALFSRRLAFGLVAAEAYVLGSKDKPDRERPELTTSGRAAFLRASIERTGFRLHAIYWRARDFVKEEGDPNYLSRSEAKTFFRALRTYGELGLAKRFELGEGLFLEPSARLNLVDSKVEYSYRLIGRVAFGLPVVK